MRVLVIGSGGREHALVWKLLQNPKVERIYVAPGNGGTASLGGKVSNLPLKDDDIPALTSFALEQGVTLVIPGPELPLTLGITDAMHQAGVPCFGPVAACARLEGSKAFAKEIMRQAEVPTAAYGTFTTLEDAEVFIKNRRAPLVVKADGLAAGKGVIIARSIDEALDAAGGMFAGQFGNAGTTVVIEEFLEGEEVSLLCFCDGKTALPLPSAQDHKAVNDGDQGPNTGGMGAYSPAPILPDDQLEALADRTVRPILRTMAARGTPFTGILYAGLMLTADGPKVLEYNVRFGDPECQPLLMRLRTDLVSLMHACIDGELDRQELEISPQSAVGVVLTAQGYPESYEQGMLITGMDEAEAVGDGKDNQVKVFQAGTRLENEEILASGGRVLCVTALGANLRAARDRAYAAVDCIHMDKSHYRRDIAQKGLNRLGC